MNNGYKEGDFVQMIETTVGSKIGDVGEIVMKKDSVASVKFSDGRIQSYYYRRFKRWINTNTIKKRGYKI